MLVFLAFRLKILIICSNLRSPGRSKILSAALYCSTPHDDPDCLQKAQAISDVSGGIGIFTFNTSPPSQSPFENVSFTLDASTPPINPEKGFAMLYTSGTTGSPKGVLHSCQSAALGLQIEIEALRLTPNDKWLQCGPVHWMAGLMMFCANLIVGC